jgi:hypothetical protein
MATDHAHGTIAGDGATRRISRRQRDLVLFSDCFTNRVYRWQKMDGLARELGPTKRDLPIVLARCSSSPFQKADKMGARHLRLRVPRNKLNE